MRTAHSIFAPVELMTMLVTFYSVWWLDLSCVRSMSFVRLDPEILSYCQCSLELWRYVDTFGERTRRERPRNTRQIVSVAAS